MSFVKGYKHISILLLTKSMHQHDITVAIAMIEPLFLEIWRSHGDHGYLQYTFSELTKMCPKSWSHSGSSPSGSVRIYKETYLTYLKNQWKLNF